MKKTIFLLGVLFFSGAFLWGVSADRLTYHQYRTNLDYRRYGYSVRPIAHRLSNDDRIKANKITRSPQLISTAARNIKPRFSYAKQLWRGYRHFRPELYYGKDIGAVKKARSGALMLPDSKIVPEEAYVFDNRLGFFPDQEGIFRSPKTSLAFRIYEVPESISCSSEKFARCVPGVMTAYRRALGVAEMGLQDFSFRQTLHDSFDYQMTYREMFEGRDGNTYFVMGLINPETDQLVRVEGVSAPKDKDLSAFHMHRIFETFQFYN